MNLTENEFWVRVKALEGTTVHTLSQGQPNKILTVNENEISIADRVSRPTKKNLYGLYTMMDSGETILSDHIQHLIEKRVSRICLAIVVQAVPEEVEAVTVGRKTGIRRRPSRR
jgi:hypothetical protein